MKHGNTKLKPIKTCRSCHSSKLTEILDMGDLYLSDFTKKPFNRSIEKYPLTLLLCESCKLVQLKESVPPKKMYTERYGYRSGINQTMKNELSEIVHKSIKIAKPLTGDWVIDIGANDGTLLSFYPSKFKRLAVEPVKKFAKDSKKYSDAIVSNFFTKKNVFSKLPKTKKAKIITAISMFYDLEDPNEFVSDIVSTLDENGLFVIQQNYLLTMLKENAFDNIVHEHLEYYSLHSLEKLLERNGLRVFDVELSFINGGSIRTFICHKSAQFKDTARLKKFRTNEEKYKLDKKTPYIEFAKRVERIKLRLRNYIEKEVKNGRRVYLYGASTRGNTILQYCELDTKLIEKAVERNPEKWGLVISSMGIPIISEEQARKEKPENMLVLPWFFKEEFIRRERAYLKHGGKFIFPLPKVKIVKGL